MSASFPTSASFSELLQVGPRRDIVGEFEKSVRQSKSLHFGLYHSLFEWFNPLFLKDVAANFSTRFYAQNKVMIRYVG